MIFEQAYYTSCEIGLKGIKGFQMNAVSSGIDQNRINNLERYSIYIPPMSMPTRPTEQQLYEFPKSLNYIKLADGTAALSRSVYLGADYSGRYGNYFTHFIVANSSSELVGDIFPILTWEANFWENKPADNTTIPALQALSMGELKKISDVMRHFNGSKMASKMASFLHCVQKAMETGRRIIIVDDDKSIASLICLASICLPKPLVQNLTFTTYVKNPYNIDTLITGTTSDSDFTFSSSEIEHQYFVFDFVNDRYTNVGSVGKFASVLGEWINKSSVDKLDAFRKHIDSLSIETSVENLDQLIDLFFLEQGYEIGFDELLKIHRYLAETGLYNQQDILNIVIAALADYDDHIREIYKIALEIFKITQASDTLSSEGKDDSAKFYIDWLLQKVLPQMTLSEINNITDKFVFKTVKVWDIIIQEIRLQLGADQDSGYMYKLLYLAKGLNILNDLTEVLGNVCKKMLHEGSPSAGLPQVLDFLLANDVSRDIDQFIYDYLLEYHEDHPTDESRYLLEYSQESHENLMTMARDRKDYRFFFYISSYVISKSRNRGEDTVELLKIMNTNRSSISLDVLNHFFAVVWHENTISMEDISKLMAYNSSAVMNSEVFVLMLMDQLMKNASILDPDQQTLSTINACVSNTDSFQHYSDVLKMKIKLCYRLFYARTKLEKCKNTKCIIDIISDAYKRIPDESEGLKQDLLKLALVYAVDENEYSYKYRELLLHLSAIDEKLLVYALKDFLGSHKFLTHKSMQIWIPIFEFIVKRKDQKDLIYPIYLDELKKSYKRFSKENQNTIQELILKNSHFSKEWQNWQQETGMKRRFLSLFNINK